MNEVFEYINLSYLNGNYPNNPSKRNKLLKLYLESMPSELDELKNYLEVKDLESIHLKAHSIKTLMLQLGINPLFNNMLYIERNAQDEDYFNLINAKFIETTQIWSQAAKEIESVINTTV